MDDTKPTKSTQSEIVCSNCGADLTFNPGTTSLKCEYCGTLNEIEVSNDEIEEIDFVRFLQTQGNEAPKQEVTTVACDSCGATTTFDPNIVSAECDFCATPLVLKNATTNSIIQPKSLLPFKIEKKDGSKLFKDWISGLWWAPNALKKYARQGKLSGVYIPYWTYDSNTYSRYSGERGDDYQETETYTEDGEEKTRTVTKTRWTSVSGTVRENFDDILVVASKSLPEKHIDGLEPWDLENLSNFDTKFLSGFKTESYQVDLKNGFEVAKDKMEVVIRSSVHSDIGGDQQRIHNLQTQYNDITFKHILLPLWISAYRFNEKVYRFMINGRTGTVKGERPYSWIKIALAIMLVVAIIAVIVFLTSK